MELMLRKTDGSDQAVMAPARIAPFDRARTSIILPVALHHSVINYTYFGHGDRMRWLGFDLVVLFQRQFLHGLHDFYLRTVRARQPGTKGSGDLPV
jgi:hypothetical protein